MNRAWLSSLTLVRKSAPLRAGGAQAPGRRRGLDRPFQSRNCFRACRG